MTRGSLRLALPGGEVLRFGPGGQPAASVRVRSNRAFRRVLLDGETGAGAAYAAGDWSADDLVAVIRLMIANRHTVGPGSWPVRFLARLGSVLRPNSVRRARRNIRLHYDLGNDFFSEWLDPSMTYSAAVFDRRSNDETLETAQWRKYEMLAEKACIRSSSNVLEIGCGWGGFAEFAARTYGCRVTGITISSAQARYARQRMARAGLQDLVSIEEVDYRHLEGTFDRIVSIEMLEAVGHAHLPGWFAACDRLLAPGGIIAAQVITVPDARYRIYRRGTDFIRRYIFPGGHLPSLEAMIVAARRRSALGLEHVENIAPHYAETLRRWRTRLLERKEAIASLGYDAEFLRAWEFYLAYCEAAFATRALSNLQLVFSRPENAMLDVPMREATP